MAPRTRSLKDMCHLAKIFNINSPESHGASMSFFSIKKKEIVEVLIVEILFEDFGEEYYNNVKYFIKGDEAERRTIINKRLNDSVTAKKRAMSIFKIQA